jgi:hypothetical protein
MSDQAYPLGKEGLLDGTIVWNGASSIKVLALRGYTYSASHKFVSDVTGAGGTIVSTSGALTGKTASALGVAKASSSTWVAVPAGAAITSVIIVQTSAVGGGADVATSSQRLIAFLDSAAGTLPITPNGLDISISISSGIVFTLT